jgi:putative ABC transport system permease protein
MLLALMFAGVALFLAALGIYGVLAYQVSQRKREIGIRMALGSDAARIFRMVVGEGMVLLSVGFAGGLALAVAVRGVLQTQLYGVGALDPTVLVTVALVLAFAAFIACIVPARRASRIDPVAALQ